jgi:hypothetical protein
MTREEIDKLIEDLDQSFDSEDLESLSDTCDQLDAIGSILSKKHNVRAKKGTTAGLRTFLEWLARRRKSDELAKAARLVSFVESAGAGSRYFSTGSPVADEGEIDEINSAIGELEPILRRLLEEPNEAG